MGSGLLFKLLAPILLCAWLLHDAQAKSENWKFGKDSQFQGGKSAKGWRGGAGVRHAAEEALHLAVEDRKFVAPSENRWRSLAETFSDSNSDSESAELQVEPQTIDAGDSVTVRGWKQSEKSGRTYQRLSHDRTGNLPTDPKIFPPQGDIIAAYCPHSTADSDYLDYREIHANDTNVTFGPLVNMRCEYEFRYLRQDSNGTYHFVSKTPAVRFHHGMNEPTQGRIVETGRVGEMTVMWVSAQADPSLVELIDLKTGSRCHITGSSITYKADDMCNHPANITSSLLFRDPGFIHKVLLTGLEPLAAYDYRFGTNESWSPMYRFRTAPLPGFDTSLIFYVFGDLGEEQGPTGTPMQDRAYGTIHRISDDIRSNIDSNNIILHVGDISYAEGKGYEWEQFGYLTQPVATAVPYFVGIGNHDYDHVAGGRKDPSRAPGNGYHPTWGVYGDDSAGECAVPIVKRFSMPALAPHSRPPFWYSHDYGLVHLLWLSTEHDFYPGSDMYEFIVSDLKQVNRSVTPWVFLLGHRPMYCSRSIDEITAKDNYIIQLHQRQAYEAVLQQYAVDVFFTGHYHAYERTCPVFNGTCCKSKDGRAEATVHMVMGTGGANQDFDRWDKHSWSRHHGIDYGYTRVYVQNATHLHTEYVLNANGAIADSAWLISTHDWNQS